LLVDINEFPVGLNADPRTAVGRAAWYSLAFFLRSAAAAEIDVDTTELDAGFRSVSRANLPIGQAFLCDKLENGAGYCRWLGEADNFKKLLDQGDSGLPRSTASLWTGTFHDSTDGSENHAGACDTSCNRCMRDFYNLPYHGLLDWRLALDMVQIASSASAVINLDYGSNGQPSIWKALLEGSAAPVPAAMQRLGYKEPVRFGSLRGYVHQIRSSLWIERHPLWTDEHPSYIESVNEARQQLPGHVVTSMNPFTALRRPADYV
jgi:hypothetical protein